MLLSLVNELHEMPCQCCLLLPFALAAAITPYYPLCYWLIIVYCFFLLFAASAITACCAALWMCHCCHWSIVAFFDVVFLKYVWLPSPLAAPPPLLIFVFPPVIGLHRSLVCAVTAQYTVLLCCQCWYHLISSSYHLPLLHRSLLH